MPLRRLGELLALTAFAIAQPVLDVTGRSPDFFVYRRANAATMALLLALVTLGPPLALWLAERLVGLVSRTAERALHLVFVAGLLTVLAVEIGKQTHRLYGRRLALVALVAGCALAVLVARSAKVRQVLVYAAPAPLLFALLFVTTTPSGALVRPARAHTATQTAAAQRPPIVVVFFDEFPVRSLLDDEGHVDASLYPNIAKLAAASTWYPNATGVSGQTPYAIPAMLTGRYPYKVAAPHYTQFPDNLFTMLGGAYDVHAFESIAQLCPPRVCKEVEAGRPTGLKPLIRDIGGVTREIVSPRRPHVREGSDLAENATNDIPDPKDTAFGLGAGKINQSVRFQGFLDSIKPGPKPSLHFLHILMPHTPFRFLPSGRRYPELPQSFPFQRGDPNDKYRRNPSPGVAEVFKQRVLLQVTYTDALVGQLIDRMKATGMWDDSLLVVTADHGAGQVAGEKSRFLDERNPPDLSFVPLFVKRPHQAKGEVDPRNEQHVDLLPTIADVAHAKVTWKVDGQSLLGPPRPTQDKKWYDSPGNPKPIDGAKWYAAAHTGFAAATVRTDAGQEGLFAIGPHRALVGKKVADLTVGAPARVTAKLDPGVAVGKVSLASGVVPALLYGTLDGAPGTGETWLLVAVNGTVSGSVVALPKGGGWWFMGMTDDAYFHDGANDVRFYAVDGTTLHPLGGGG